MMRASLIVAAILATPSLAFGQVGGNVGFGQAGARGRAEAAENAKRIIAKDDLPPSRNSMFVEANVLVNVKADEFVAVFAIARDGPTAEDAAKKMDETVKSFSEALKKLGIAADDLFVDFIAQNKIYGFELADNVAREKLVGLELKKNVSIHYRDRALIDALVSAAAKSQVFDLVKVDYVVKDAEAIHQRLAEEAARILKKKAARYQALLDIKLRPPAQVIVERSSAYYPTQMYDSYAAFEAEGVSTPLDRQKYAVQTARKSRTFYFNSLDSNGFDTVVNPVVIEPVVQFTLYTKVKYEIEPPKPQ